MIWGGKQVLDFKKYVSDILFPVFCLQCDKEGEWVCQSCLNKIESLEQTSCIGCGSKVQQVACCQMCLDTRPTQSYWSLYKYHTPLISSVILQLKYHGAFDIERTLVKLLYQHKFIYSYIENKFDCIVPVPLHPIRFRERGFNQSDCVARAVSEVFGIPIVNALIRTKVTKQQALLSGVQRKENVVGAFVCTDVEGVFGKRVLLIDDVLTTGSTIDACAVALNNAGVQTSCALTLAHG